MTMAYCTNKVPSTISTCSACWHAKEHSAARVTGCTDGKIYVCSDLHSSAKLLGETFHGQPTWVGVGTLSYLSQPYHYHNFHLVPICTLRYGLRYREPPRSTQESPVYLDARSGPSRYCSQISSCLVVFYYGSVLRKTHTTIAFCSRVDSSKGHLLWRCRSPWSIFTRAMRLQ